jgi:Protein of unknown function (DUF2865)
MTPLADRWDGRWGGAGRRPQSTVRLFGTSGRNPSRDYDDDDDRPYAGDDEDRHSGTYRSVCVRLCDGYYFPISFAVTADRLGRDREVCESRCGGQGRLFVHRNPGGSTDDLQDLSGRAYRQLPTAFLYRTELVPSCKCQPDPWETAAQERHRVYALDAAARKGDKTAGREARALAEKLKSQEKLVAAPAAPKAAASPGPEAASLVRSREIARRGDEAPSMGLGGDGAPTGRADASQDRAPPKARAEPDWIRRAFDPGSGR